jgi:hypothetical protein
MRKNTPALLVAMLQPTHEVPPLALDYINVFQALYTAYETLKTSPTKKLCLTTGTALDQELEAAFSDRIDLSELLWNIAQYESYVQQRIRFFNIAICVNEGKGDITVDPNDLQWAFIQGYSNSKKPIDPTKAYHELYTGTRPQKLNAAVTRLRSLSMQDRELRKFKDVNHTHLGRAIQEIQQILYGEEFKTDTFSFSLEGYRIRKINGLVEEI